MKQKRITAFCCHNALYAGLDLTQVERAYVEDVHIIETPCSGKVDPIYILKAFEKGADCVVVMACNPKQCATTEGSARAEKRVERVKVLMEEAGLAPERLILVRPKRPALGLLENIFDKVKKTADEIGPTPVK